MGPKLRLALIGWGAIGRTAASLLNPDLVEIVAVGVRSATQDRPGVPGSAVLITDPTDLASARADVVAEAAGRDSVGPWGRAALGASANYVVSSVSAFADPELLDELRSNAQSSSAQLHIQPGALAGVEALSAARYLGLNAVEHRIVKPPAAWSATPAETLCDLESLRDPVTFFEATAAETASRFPKNANVAMTTALAGVGPERTTIKLVADPATTTNRHEIAAHGAFGTLEVAIANNPLPANPKTSAMAALSLVRTIENQIAPIVI